MTDYNFFENWLCSRVISDKVSSDTAGQKSLMTIAQLQTNLANAIREKNAIIANAATDKQADLAKIDELNVQITTLQSQIDQLQIQLNQQGISPPSTSPTFGNLPARTQTTLLAYMNKYPEAYITYGGRYWGSNHERYDLDVKAWLLQGQNDYEMIRIVQNAKGRLSDVLAEQPTLSFHQACDIAFMRVTHALGDSISYQYDDRAWGENEFWQFGSETRVMTTGDCEDKAIMNYVGARIAGIPWEMLRITAGLTYDGQGHATNFYFASDLQWHHRNSTSNYPATKPVTSLPLPGDSSESLNIKYPWFSATETKTFNWFGTEAEKQEAMVLQDQPFFKFLKIFHL